MILLFLLLISIPLVHELFILTERVYNLKLFVQTSTKRIHDSILHENLLRYMQAWFKTGDRAGLLQQKQDYSFTITELDKPCLIRISMHESSMVVHYTTDSVCHHYLMKVEVDKKGQSYFLMS